MLFAKCVACDQEIEIGSNPRVGWIVSCHHCGSELEVIRTTPPKLDWPFYEDDNPDDDFRPQRKSTKNNRYYDYDDAYSGRKSMKVRK